MVGNLGMILVGRQVAGVGRNECVVGCFVGFRVGKAEGGGVGLLDGGEVGCLVG